MNLYESIYELNGYIKAIGDQGKPVEELKSFIENGKDVNIYPSLPDKSQWLRICLDLSRIINHLEKLGK